jgi:hypothetical protein
MSRDFKNLFPHERKILENEFFKEKLVQKRLEAAISDSYRRYREKIEFEIKNIITKVLKEKGYTAEDVMNADDDPELTQLIWKTLEENIELLAKLPLKRLKEIFKKES